MYVENVERRKFVRLGKSSETVNSDAGIRDMGYRKVTERDRNPKTSHSGYNSKPKNL